MRWLIFPILVLPLAAADPVTGPGSGNVLPWSEAQRRPGQTPGAALEKKVVPPAVEPGSPPPPPPPPPPPQEGETGVTIGVVQRAGAGELVILVDGAARTYTAPLVGDAVDAFDPAIVALLAKFKPGDRVRVGWVRLAGLRITSVVAVE